MSKCECFLCATGGSPEYNVESKAMNSSSGNWNPETGQYSYNQSVAKASTNTPATESLDGRGANDRNQDYTFGRKPTALSPFPFTERQFARLLIVRGKHLNDEFGREGN